MVQPMRQLCLARRSVSEHLLAIRDLDPGELPGGKGRLRLPNYRR